jgi:hypothetical protein
MATGYTCGVQDGQITTLRDYALTCARAFGALITMRDEPSDTPIPERFEPNTEYYDTKIATAQKMLEELPKLTDAECDAMAATAFSEAASDYTKRQIEKSQQKVRYEEMLQRVERWQVPEELDGLKDFMASQLRESISFDCSGDYPSEPIRLTGARWREEALAEASRSLSYSSIKRAKEIDRVKGRNEWLAALRRALPASSTAEAA